MPKVIRLENGEMVRKSNFDLLQILEQCHVVGGMTSGNLKMRGSRVVMER